MTSTWTLCARAAVAGALFALAAMPALAQGNKRPAPSVLIAAAKATPLEKFQVRDEIKGLKVEAWLTRRVGTKGRIAWRSTSCRAKAGDRDLYNSPICVEAVIRYRNGISLTVGIGFGETAPGAAPVADAMWGSVAAKGGACEFLRHPDHIDAALENIDDTIKAGRCV